jgi:hypothetical protein
VPTRKATLHFTAAPVVVADTEAEELAVVVDTEEAVAAAVTAAAILLQVAAVTAAAAILLRVVAVTAVAAILLRVAVVTAADIRSLLDTAISILRIPFMAADILGRIGVTHLSRGRFTGIGDGIISSR